MTSKQRYDAEVKSMAIAMKRDWAKALKSARTWLLHSPGTARYPRRGGPLAPPAKPVVCPQSKAILTAWVEGLRAFRSGLMTLKRRVGLKTISSVLVTAVAVAGQRRYTISYVGPGGLRVRLSSAIPPSFGGSLRRGN